MHDLLEPRAVSATSLIASLRSRRASGRLRSTTNARYAEIRLSGAPGGDDVVLVC